MNDPWIMQVDDIREILEGSRVDTYIAAIFVHEQSEASSDILAARSKFDDQVEFLASIMRKMASAYAEQTGIQHADIINVILQMLGRRCTDE